MSILELVAMLSSPLRSRRDRAGVELYAIVLTLCARPNAPPRSYAPVLVPPPWREDVAHDVMLRLTEDGAAIVQRVVARNPAFARLLDGTADEALRLQAHRATETYLRRTIAARYLTLVRRTRIVQEFDLSRVAAPMPADPDDRNERGLRVVEAVVDRLDAAADLRVALGEMCALAAGELSMSECIERDAGRALSGAAFRTARNRLQQRHRRLRVTLLGAIAQLATEGVLDPDDAASAVWFVEHVLNRAPKRRRG